MRKLERSAIRLRRDAFLVGTGATLGAPVIVTAPAKAAQYEFKCGTGLDVEHPSFVRCKQLFDAVERESGGRIHTQLFASNALGTNSAMLSQVRLGAIQFVSIGPGPIQPFLPATDILNVAFVFDDEAAALHTVDGPVGTYLSKEAAAKGPYMLPKMLGSGMREMTSSSHPIRTAEDLAGFKIRIAASKIIVDFFKTVGASAVSLDNSEMYTAMQTKLVDGNDVTLLTIQADRMWEVQKYLCLTNHAWTGLWLVANGEMWKGLPSDLQDIINRNSAKYSLLERRDTKILNASVAEKLGRQGFIVNKVDPASFQQRLQPYYSAWANNLGPTAWGALEASVDRKLG